MQKIRVGDTKNRVNRPTRGGKCYVLFKIERDVECPFGRPLVMPISMPNRFVGVLMNVHMIEESIL
jgi:hypothetical protein